MAFSQTTRRRHAALILLLAATLLSAATGQAATFAKCIWPLPAYQPGVPNYATIIGQSLITTRGRPAAVVIAHGTRNVAKIVKCARRAALSVCARSGGHALDGRTLCQGAVMIDVSKIRGVSVSSTGLAVVGTGATLGETLWKLHAKGRWFSSGVCPGVGIGGFMLGGGLGPYEGKLGLGCDALEAVTMVTRDGNVIKASRTLRQGLFWSMCGTGGAQFGIVTQFTIRTASSAHFDRAVVFRYKWPLARSGELLEKYARYEADGGSTWVRMVTSSNGGGMTGLGACFGVDTIAQCVARMSRAEFFNTPGRQQLVLLKAKSALQVSGFVGPAGNYGKRIAPNLWQAYNTYRYADGGKGNRNSDQSAFLSFAGGKMPTREFWQTYVNYCDKANLPSNKWLVCQINLFKNAVRKRQQNAFPFRAATLLAHFTIGPANDVDRKKAYDWMRRHFAPYTVGVYVNYQDPELKSSYPKMYWGSSLPYLKKLKAKYDPNRFFANPQPIPVV